MKKAFIATAIVASLAFNPFGQNANATTDKFEPENETQREVVGFSSGLVTGAAFGGPLGAILGGVVGILIADGMNKEETMSAQLTALSRANKEIYTQEQSLLALQSDLRDMKNKQMVQAVRFEESQQQILQEKIGSLQTNIQFKTASVAVEDVYQGQLNSIAEILRQFPELTVRLEGYADQRGDSNYNQALSAARAEAVASYLLDLNVDKSQLTYAGNGEANNRDLTKTSKEILFFDRRVSIRIVPKGNILTAAK